MLFLESFTFPDGDAEFDFCLGIKRKCYTSYYPFGVLSQRRFTRIDFAPVTILCGANGSGKSTALHVIAQVLGAQRSAPFNGSPFFADYARLCSAHTVGEPPTACRMLTSDDVFDAMLDVRSLNDGIDRAREHVFEDYLRDKRTGFQLRSMDDYETLRRVNRARTQTQSRYTRETLGMNVRTYSNGENAFRLFTNQIDENALYLLDEPENSLSPARQAELADYLHQSARFFGCQLIIATHSPFVLAIPGAKIYDLDSDPVTVRRFTQLAHVRAYYDLFARWREAFERETEL